MPASPVPDLPFPTHRGADGSEGSLAAIQIAILTPIEVEGALYPLSLLLGDAVAAGASIGFIHPMANGEALAYWKSTLPAIRSGEKLLLTARRGGILVGSVQLNLESRASGRHRADISKLIVLSNARRQGIGRAMMLAAEAEALRLGRTTLLLDVREGDASEALYQSLGWRLAGIIPAYARSSDGDLDASAFYYKLLDE